MSKMFQVFLCLTILCGPGCDLRTNRTTAYANLEFNISDDACVGLISSLKRFSEKHDLRYHESYFDSHMGRSTQIELIRGELNIYVANKVESKRNEAADYLGEEVFYDQQKFRIFFARVKYSLFAWDGYFDEAEMRRIIADFKATYPQACWREVPERD